MNHDLSFGFDPELDLELDRTVNIPPEAVWAGWTRPEILTKWFCPLPWITTSAEVDLRPGGRFNNVMRSPGARNPTTTDVSSKRW